MRALSRWMVLAAATVGLSFAAAAQEPWRDFRDQDQGFLVQFPGKPQIQRSKVGDVAFVNYFALLGESIFQVVVDDLPRPSPQSPDAAYYHRHMLDYARNHNKRINSEQMVTLAGHPAAEAKMTDAVIGADFLVDLVAVGKHFYAVASAGRPGHAETAEARHFRDSFRFLGP
ncbi:MAG: hypothetical protein WBF58_24725 [Xanthobacteraceae bacterium]